MELGQRLKQARLEAGLSQRQLCGDTITRNMLSQIENGSARPSMDTLRILAQRLGKPMGYFLEEQTASPNQKILLSARQAEGAQALALLEQYQSPDPVLDPERYLLEVLRCLELAQQAIGEKRLGYAVALLEQAGEAGAQTPYFTQDLERRRQLLRYKAGVAARDVVASLPDSTEEFLLRAEAEEDLSRRAAILEAAPGRTPCWHLLRAQVYFAQKDYPNAARHFEQAEESRQVFAWLEQCYRELEDYKMAYFYACKQR